MPLVYLQETVSPEEWKRLRPGDRLKKNPSAFSRSLHLWKVVSVDPAGVGLWCSADNTRKFVVWSELEEMTVVWEEGARAPEPKSIWERLSEED